MPRLRGSDSTDFELTRRKALAGIGTVLAGGGAVAITTRDARAEVTMGSLDVGDDSATLGSAPSKVTITVSGEYDIVGPATPEQARLTLQVTYDGTSDDLDTQVDYESTSGTYSLSADLYSHRAVSSGDLLPETAGASASWDLTVRVILSVVQDGEIQTEKSVEDTAQLSITRDGYELSVGGSGDVNVTA